MYGPFTAVVSINEQPLTSLRSASKVRAGTRTHTWSILKIRHAYSRGQLPAWMRVAYFTVRNRTTRIFFVFLDRAISYESKPLLLFKCRSVQYAAAPALCTIYEPGVVCSLHAGSACNASLAKKSP